MSEPMTVVLNKGEKDRQSLIIKRRIVFPSLSWVLCLLKEEGKHISPAYILNWSIKIYIIYYVWMLFTYIEYTAQDKLPKEKSWLDKTGTGYSSTIVRFWQPFMVWLGIFVHTWQRCGQEDTVCGYLRPASLNLFLDEKWTSKNFFNVCKCL